MSGYCGSFFLAVLFLVPGSGLLMSLLLCDLIVDRYRPVGGALPYFKVNVGIFDYAKKRKKNKRANSSIVLEGPV